MNRLNKTESAVVFILYVLSSSEGSGFFFSDYLEVAAAVVVPRGVGKRLSVHRNSVDNFSYSGPT